MLKTAHVALVLSLLLPLTHAAGAPHASFSHGFSSHSAAMSHAAPAAPKSSGFGSFSRSSAADTGAAAPGAPAAARSSGGFGSFGGNAAPKQSDSALSQQLSHDAAQARALQTLDQRRAAQQAQNAPPPAPNGPQPAATYAQPTAAPTTVIVNQNNGSGLGNVIAGTMIANSMSAHARSSGYGAPGASYGTAAGAAQGGTSFVRLFLSLCLLALIAWGIWFAWKGIQRRRAAVAAANKPNYSFERN